MLIEDLIPLGNSQGIIVGQYHVLHIDFFFFLKCHVPKLNLKRKKNSSERACFSDFRFVGTWSALSAGLGEVCV